MKRFHKIFSTFLFLYTYSNLYAQTIPLNKYQLPVIENEKILLEQIKQDSTKKLIRLKSFIPNLAIELRYAGNNNFLKRKLYKKNADAFLRLNAATALKNVQTELNELGLGLKIWDAYRPYYVTEEMWEAVKDDRYAADPKKGSGHNRGIAVDLTIIDLKTNAEIPMPTGFDNFSDTAHHSFMNISDTAIKNRNLLKTTMEKHSFKSLSTEWWHYFLPEAQQYELLNIEFKKLKKIK